MKRTTNNERRVTNKLNIMKKLITFIFAVTIAVQPVSAQQIDLQQMRQDIDIAESILGEMFEGVKENERFTLLSTDFNNVQGTYLPDYGVLFKIGAYPVSDIYIHGDENGAVFLKNGNKYTVKKSNNDDDKAKSKINKQIIIKKITQFIAKYGATIGQLSDGDKIAVIYGGANERGWRLFIVSGQMMSMDEHGLPVISIVAQRSDIEDYNHRNLSIQAFKDRLSISVQESDKKAVQDLKIMANILETVLESDKEQQFEVSGDVNYQLIDNFGAFYSFEIDYGSSFNIINGIPIKSFSVNLPDVDDYSAIYNLNGALIAGNDSLVSGFVVDSSYIDSVKKQFTRYQFQLAELRAQQKIKAEQIKKRAEAIRNKVRKQLEERNKTVDEAFELFLKQLKELIVKYGPTLDSVSSGQNIVFSIDVNTLADKLPERLILQVKKSTLIAVASGDISKQQAMAAISVRKF